MERSFTVSMYITLLLQLSGYSVRGKLHSDEHHCLFSSVDTG